MNKSSILTIVGPSENEYIEFQKEIGVRHLMRFEQANNYLNLNLKFKNETEASMEFAKNGYITIMSESECLIFTIPEKLTNCQIKFLEDNKQFFYGLNEEDYLIQGSIYSEEGTNYNKNQKYRDLAIEQEIARYEGKIISSPLDILYDEIDNQKKHVR